MELDGLLLYMKNFKDVVESGYWLTDCIIPVLFWDNLEKP
jgi:hypothetical protein